MYLQKDEAWYVLFINTNQEEKVKKIPGIIKLLGNEDEDLTVAEKEIKVLKILLNNDDNNIGISTLYKKNDSIIIISGPLLLGLEGQIMKIDCRKGRVKVNIRSMNEERIVELGIELVDKI